jgi:hypothetical protein
MGADQKRRGHQAMKVVAEAGVGVGVGWGLGRRALQAGKTVRSKALRWRYPWCVSEEQKA